MVCTHDNPDTMCRECWQNGVLVYSVSAKLLSVKGGIPPEHFFFGANIGKWKSGQVAGNLKAKESVEKSNDLVL